MFRNTQAAKLFLSLLLFLSLSFQGLTVKGQDLVAADDITGGGSSVFVFRGSRKKPQTRASGGFAFASGRGHSGLGRSHVNSQIFAAERKKRTQTVAANTRTRQQTAAGRRLAMSNTLTAKAETQLDANQTDAAIASYREALKLNPRNTKATEGLSDALTAKGIELAATSKTDAATALEEAVKLDPKNAVAYAKLGEISDAQELTERAMAPGPRATRRSRSPRRHRRPSPTRRIRPGPATSRRRPRARIGRRNRITARRTDAGRASRPCACSGRARRFCVRALQRASRKLLRPAVLPIRGASRPGIGPAMVKRRRLLSGWRKQSMISGLQSRSSLRASSDRSLPFFLSKPLATTRTWLPAWRMRSSIRFCSFVGSQSLHHRERVII